ncbi:phage holin family protein [Bacillus sp. FJAT-27445]|uniref:phage holin family protein n=1 Tax=Bacillus sp. FJAT-27445 TaxID=1679166 RepID=UPI00074403DE|nr:phage holin family protein [Bacillus sp. FJAT-27445]
MRWLIGIGINAVLFMAIAGYFDDEFRLSGFGAAIAASFLLSILNVLVRPVLILLTLPATILTLGLFLFVINAVTLLLTDALMGPAFDISGFGMAFLAAVIISLVNIVIQKFIMDKKKK